MSRQRSMEKIETSEYVSIGELARLTGCRYSTLKFYTEEGMLPFEQPEENLTRRFPREQAIARLNQIQEKKAQGLSIPEIKQGLPPLTTEVPATPEALEEGPAAPFPQATASKQG